MTWMIISIILIVISIGAQVIGAWHEKKNWVALVALFVALISSAIPQIYNLFKEPTPVVKISNESMDSISARIKEILITSDNKDLKRLADLGIKEEERSLKIKAAIDAGDSMAKTQNKENQIRAISYYRQALATDPKSSERFSLCYLIASSYWINQEFDSSIVYYQEAIKIMKELIPDPEHSEERKKILINAFGNLAMAYMGKLQFSDAISAWTQSIEVGNTMPDKIWNITAYMNLGTTYQLIGEYDLAEKMYLLRADCLKNDSDKKFLGWTYEKLGDISVLKGDNKKAKYYYSEGLRIFKNVDSDYDINSSIEQIKGKLGKIKR